MSDSAAYGQESFPTDVPQSRMVGSLMEAAGIEPARPFLPNGRFAGIFIQANISRLGGLR